MDINTFIKAIIGMVTAIVAAMGTYHPAPADTPDSIASPPYSDVGEVQEPDVSNAPPITTAPTAPPTTAPAPTTAPVPAPSPATPACPTTPVSPPGAVVPTAPVEPGDNDDPTGDGDEEGSDEEGGEADSEPTATGSTPTVGADDARNTDTAGTATSGAGAPQPPDCTPVAPQSPVGELAPAPAAPGSPTPPVAVTPGTPGTVTTPTSDGTPGARPVTCDPNQGMTCVAESGELDITEGGTPEAPKIYSGNGQTPVAGINVEADNVIVQGFLMEGADGITATGNNITIQDNTIRNPSSHDGDGIRFFGDNIEILHNLVSGTDNSLGHADCMQTFATSTPSSSNLLVEGNRCEKIANICLMAEGPGDTESDGSGEGESKGWIIRNNYCEFGAAQGYMIEYVSDVTITGNEVVGDSGKGVGLCNVEPAEVSGNKLTGIEEEVIRDDC